MRNAGRTIVVLGIVAVFAVVVTSPAFAGKGNRGGHKQGGTGTIDIVKLDSTDGLVHFGQHVTFVVTTNSTTYPWVTARCKDAAGTVVYKQSNGIFPTSLNQIFTLGPTPMWISGDAECTATLEDWDSYSKNGSITAITSMPFHVYA